jgi:hypothetical protein
MALRERAALASWPDRRIGAFLDQRGEGQRSPVAQSMPSPVSIILARLSMKALDGAVRLEVVRHFRQLLAMSSAA